MTTDYIETNAVTLAEAKLAELTARLERARETAAANRSRAHELAFDAEARDDDAAKRLATKLIADADKLEADVEHRLEPAVAEAARRVKAAKEAVADEAQRERAEEARALAERLEAIGAARDAAPTLKAREGEFDDVMNRLRLLGAPTPSRELIKVNSNRALDAALFGVYPAARPVPPLQRHTFAGLYAGWARPMLNWAARILDEPAAAEHGRAA